MLKAELPFLVAVVGAGFVSIAVAYAVGTPTLRLRGAYFAIGTLALAESAKQLALAWDRLTRIPLTGGSAGISLPLSAGYLPFYYVMLALMAGVTGVALWLQRSTLRLRPARHRGERPARRGFRASTSIGSSGACT